MKFDGLAKQRQSLLLGVAGRNTARKVGHVRAIRRRSLFNNHEIAHVPLLLLQSGLLQDAIESTRRHVGASVSSNGNRTGFDWMVKLAMTSCDSHLHPSVRLDKGNEFANLHNQSLPSSWAFSDYRRSLYLSAQRLPLELRPLTRRAAAPG